MQRSEELAQQQHGNAQADMARQQELADQQAAQQAAQAQQEAQQSSDNKGE
jgi:hypothetical protein